MYEFNAILKTDLKNLYTNPMWWIGSIGLPLLLALAMGFITAGIYGTAVTSFDYYAITMLIFGALNNATIAANSFMETRLLKANMRICNAPIPDYYIYLPKAIASFLFGTLCHTITAIVLYMIAGVNFGRTNAVFLWLLLAAVDFFAVNFSLMMCCLLKNEETVNMILSNIIMTMCLLGGVFFPVKGIGYWGEIISTISPVSWICTAAFRSIYDDSLQLLGYVGGGLFILSVLCILFTGKLFIREEYL